MNLGKTEVMSMLNAKVNDNMSLAVTHASNTGMTMGYDAKNSMSCYGYWRDYYYPTVIKESYPVYLQERSQDKGKQAFEIIKVLKDKKLVNMSKVADFIDLMDELIKIL